MKYLKRSQYKYAKSRYRIRNWPQDEAGLRRRGDLTVLLALGADPPVEGSHPAPRSVTPTRTVTSPGSVIASWVFAALPPRPRAPVSSTGRPARAPLPAALAVRSIPPIGPGPTLPRSFDRSFARFVDKKNLLTVDRFIFRRQRPVPPRYTRRLSCNAEHRHGLHVQRVLLHTVHSAPCNSRGQGSLGRAVNDASL